jgi:NADPH:quinone reductase
MFAHKIMDFTGPDDVQWVEVPESAENLGDGGAVIDVVAAGVSFADLLQTRGAYQMRVALPYTPGMDAAGVVRSAAPGLGLRAGQRVAVLLSYGCWQEVVSAPAERILPLPDGMSFEAGAAAPVNYLTSLFALVRRARAQTGETLLVHGAAGGVGTAAVQLGRALGLRTVAVAGDEAKKAFALQCGADHAVLTDGWLAAVRDLVGERAVDIVVDPVGSDRMTDSLRSLAQEGRLLVLGFAGGEIPVVKANRLLLGNTGVLGVASREFFEQRPAIVAELWTQLMDLRRTGALADPPVEAYPFAEARGALRAIADRRARGKIVLSRRVDAAPPLDQSALAGEWSFHDPAVPRHRDGRPSASAPIQTRCRLGSGSQGVGEGKRSRRPRPRPPVPRDLGSVPRRAGGAVLPCRDGRHRIVSDNVTINGGSAMAGYRPMTLADLAGYLSRAADDRTRWKLTWE